MEALDNPSYFSLPGGSTSGIPASTSRKPFCLLKRRGANVNQNMGANSSSASVSSSTCTSSSLINSGGNRSSCSAPTTPTTTEAASIPLLSTPSPPAPGPFSSHSHNRRSFRSLLRSVSANSHHHHGSHSANFHQLQQQLLVLGEPRPSDMAPEASCISHHHISSGSSPGKEDNHHRRNHSSKSIKSPKSSMELLNNDMVYCPVPFTPTPASPPVPPTSANSEEILSESPEEVFLGNGDARYYNLTAAMTIPLPGSNGSNRRRHSIGTFLNKDRGASGSVTKAPTAISVPVTPETEIAPNNDPLQKISSTNLSTKMQDVVKSSASVGSPEWRHPSSVDIPRSAHSRRRCNRCCNTKGNRAADMDDILIVSSNQSDAADLWVNYLKVCFEQINRSRKKQPFKIMCVGLEDVTGSQVLPYGFEEKMTHVKLQIVIICPQFLHHIYENPEPATKLGRLLQPDRVLAMLLGVDETAVTEQHRAALISYQQWHHLSVKDRDESFVSKFLQEALDMMARVWRQQTLRADKALFSVIPKKVKAGHNKVIVLLNEPTEKEDKIKVSVDKNGERLEISTVKRRNPYTFHFQMPESCLEVSMLVSIHVEKNGQALGFRQVKCESRMSELDQILRSCDSPLDFMCQTLGFSPGDREHLDNFLVSSFQRNIPPHFNLLHPKHAYHHRTHTSPQEYPTLLHFAARNGLEKFAWQLLECPGGEYACEIRNVCELTPAEMAESAGHSKLANTLRGYMQMTEFTSMYSYLKIMTEGNAKTTDFSEAEYHQPRPLNETYQVPPSARNLMDNYQVPPTARPYFPPEEEIGYMEMHSSASCNRSPSPATFKFSSDQLNTVTSSPETQIGGAQPSTPVPTSPKSDSIDQLNLEEEKQLLPGSIKKSREQINQHYGAQEELVEILSDFKNKIFTIAEVEMFVENWRNRNDVRQSFKEKQEQLNQMREEYERIQQKIKDSMKRATPFERIRKFFKGKPKESKNSNGSTGSCQDRNHKSTGSDTLPVCQRPSSSLSLHSISSSSSSSGRMSTVSGCSGASMGDSGTHSDPEDRKMFSPPVDLTKYNFRMKNVIQNNEIPPAPRKYSPPCYTTAPVRQVCTPPPIGTSGANIPIEDRPPWPSPRPDLEENESVNDSKCNKNSSDGKQNGTNCTENHPEEEDADYLDLHEVQEELVGCDYVNVPGVDTNKTFDKESSSSSAIKAGTVTADAVEENEELPDYVNVVVSQPEPTVPPPVPPRNK